MSKTQLILTNGERRCNIELHIGLPEEQFSTIIKPGECIHFDAPVGKVLSLEVVAQEMETESGVDEKISTESSPETTDGGTGENPDDPNSSSDVDPEEFDSSD